MARIEVPIVVVDLQGNAVSGAAVRIKNRVTGQDRTLYTTEAGGTTASNPITTNSAGRAEAWVEEGKHMAVITGTGITPYVEYFDGVAGVNPSFSNLSLPSSPRHGEEAFYQETSGILWRFRYNADSPSTYKWEFVGGSPFRASYATQQSVTNSATPFTGVAITNSPEITLPFAGDYEIEWALTGQASAAAAVDWRVGAKVGSTYVAPTGGPAVSSYASGAWQSIAYKTRVNGAAASSLVKLFSMSGTASLAMLVFDMTLAVTPVRVI